jgi:hypothetical protein
MTIYRLTPARWPEAASASMDVDRLVAHVLEDEPPHVVVGDFDQKTAALIADRLVAGGIENVHVEGSGVPFWPTPRSVCDALLKRLQALS